MSILKIFAVVIVVTSSVIFTVAETLQDNVSDWQHHSATVIDQTI